MKLPRNIKIKWKDLIEYNKIYEIVDIFYDKYNN